MGGLNLEVFKFGMYVMFPIGIMFYFGTNLDERFAVPEFWPRPEQANRVPFEKDEIQAELQRLRTRRLYLRDRRLEQEAAGMKSREDNNNEGQSSGEKRPSKSPGAYGYVENRCETGNSAMDAHTNPVRWKRNVIQFYETGTGVQDWASKTGNIRHSLHWLQYEDGLIPKMMQIKTC
ncbi:hypothetical protein GGS20DRAFT_583122 [Poronia punctata]|nr:hypothetical protein GGS20DRAFT_583122 [Poronia punctata]